ncbi:MAG: hypothetical protein AAFW60_08055 [Pseudomonadota bacterium]
MAEKACDTRAVRAYLVSQGIADHVLHIARHHMQLIRKREFANSWIAPGANVSRRSSVPGNAAGAIAGLGIGQLSATASSSP